MITSDELLRLAVEEQGAIHVLPLRERRGCPDAITAAKAYAARLASATPAELAEHLGLAPVAKPNADPFADAPAGILAAAGRIAAANAPGPQPAPRRRRRPRAPKPKPPGAFRLPGD